MRDPYVELGIGIIGQAVRDWRLWSEIVGWKEERDPRLRMIEDFFHGELASLCLHEIDLEPKIILEKLRKENAEKRKLHEAGVISLRKEVAGNDES